MSTREDRKSRVSRKLDTTASGEMESRPKRVPLSGNRDVLTVEFKDEGFVYRWLNDVGNRIHKALAAGYEFVSSKDHRVGMPAVSSASNMGEYMSKDVGGSVIAYLMRIPREWYEQDQLAKQKDLDARMKGLYASQREKMGKGAYGNFDVTNES